MTLEGKRVLVTGGLGFLGSHLVRALSPLCKNVRVLDNAPESRWTALGYLPNVEWWEQGVNDWEYMTLAMESVDVVFHLAAIRAPLCDQNPRLCVETMIDGTLNVLEAAAQAGVGKIVFASSRMVYEAFPKMYGLAKCLGESMLAGCATPGVSLRYFNLYGPGMNYGTAHDEALVMWMKAIEQKKSAYVNGQAMCDFLYVSDAVSATCHAAMVETAEWENVGSGEKLPLSVVYDRLCRTGRGEPWPPYESMPSVARRSRLPGWTPKVSLEEGMRRTWEWWENRDRPLR